MKNCMPESIDDLFVNREQTYTMFTEESLDNKQSMDLFIDELGLHDLIFLDEGTQIQLKHSDFPFMLQVDSAGLGDFYSHKFDVKISAWEDEIDEEAIYH